MNVNDYWDFPGGSDCKESACSAGDLGLNLGREDPPEKGMATHSCILAWKITQRSLAYGVPGFFILLLY